MGDKCYLWWVNVIQKSQKGTSIMCSHQATLIRACMCAHPPYTQYIDA